MQAEAGKMPEERHPGLGSRLGASKEPIGVETPIDPWISGSGNAYGYVSIRLCSTIKKGEYEYLHSNYTTYKYN